MTNLTDAVARAINEADAEPQGKRHSDEFFRREARAAIAEFCRYLREDKGNELWLVVNRALGEKWDEVDETRILRALASHIEGENPCSA